MSATALQLSAEQVRQYRDDGYVVLGRVLTDDDIAELLAEEERLRPAQGYGAEDNRTLVVSMQHCHRSAAVRRVCTSGGQVPLVVQLLGPDVCLTHNQILTKLPDAADTWRYVAAGELGSGVFFNPVDPLEAAERLRSASSPSRSQEA